MARYGGGYTVYDAIARSRARSQFPSYTPQPTPATTPGGIFGTDGTPKTSTSTVEDSTRISGALPTGGFAASAGQYKSPFMDPNVTFEMTPSGVVGTPITEATSKTGSGYLTGPEAAGKAVMGTYGAFDVTTKAGKAMESVLAAFDPNPFGLTGLVAGELRTDPYGRSVARPGGMLGAVTDMVVEKQHEVASKIFAGEPGYHQFYSGGQLVSLVPQNNPLTGNQVGYAVLGATGIDAKAATAQYAAMFGYDPRSVDLSKRPGQKGFGLELQGFVQGSGGVAQDGTFIGASGGQKQISGKDIERHLGLVADIYGVQEAGKTLQGMNVRDDVKSTLMGALERGEMTAEAIVDKDGNIVGYGTGVGNVVRSGDDSIVTTKDGLVTSGQGVMSPNVYNYLRQEAEFDRQEAEQGALDAPTPGTQRVDTGDGGGGDYTTVSGRGTTNFNQSDRSEASARGETFFAEGGPVVPTPEAAQGEAPVVADAGFVGTEPENVPVGDTVADDIPMDVPEGTFVLNAAAVEFMGSADVKKMILQAMQEAEKQGIDISQRSSKIPKEELVSLVVSKGEVIIPPELAQIIGYDRLNKINNRGKAEVEKRQAENGEQPEGERIVAAEGADTRGMIDLGDVVDYRDFKNPQTSWMNMLEVTGAGATGNLEAMEKAFSYSRKWNAMTKSGDNFEDTMRHTLVGGLYGDVGGFYADAKEQFHKYVEAYPKIGYEKAKGMLGYEADPEQIDIARKIIAESDVDLNNNAYGRELRRRIPDEQQYVRTVERMMQIATQEGFDALPALTTEDGEELRLQLSTVPSEEQRPEGRKKMAVGGEVDADDADSMDSGYDTSTVGMGTNTMGSGGDNDGSSGSRNYNLSRRTLTDKNRSDVSWEDFRNYISRGDVSRDKTLESLYGTEEDVGKVLDANQLTEFRGFLEEIAPNIATPDTQKEFVDEFFEDAKNLATKKAIEAYNYSINAPGVDRADRVVAPTIRQRYTGEKEKVDDQRDLPNFLMT